MTAGFLRRSAATGREAGRGDGIMRLPWLLCLAMLPAAGQTLYVAPEGSDAWSGRLPAPNAAHTDGPLASLAAARDRLRGRPRTEPATVQIAAGQYRLAEPLRLGPQDSLTHWVAAPGARPVFSGGVEITGVQVTADGLWRATVPDGVRFEQLWVNGERATPARSPNEFYYYTTEKVTYGVDPLSGEPADLSRRAFRARADDLEPLYGMAEDELAGVTLVAFHSWEHSRHRIAAVDPDTGTVVTTGPAVWPFMQWGAAQRFRLEGFLAALDQPGEWCLDPDGVLWYLPRPGEVPAESRLIAPRLEQFVIIAGDPDLGLLVEDVTFEGLTFEHAGWTLPPQGNSDAQASHGIPAVIQADAARRLSLIDCDLRHTGTWAVWFHRGVRDSRVERCYLHDLGAGGVRLGQGWNFRPLPEGERTAGNVVDNCIIRNGGRIHHGAVGVWIGHSPDNRVTHNDIADFFYTGISVGWVWGFGESHAVRNTIDDNHIHHVGWGVLSDMGGVYTLGISPGTTVSGNHIHDVWSFDRYGRGGWGLYNDEGSSHIVMERNLVHDVKTGTYHQHYGEENIIRNNILAFSRDGQLQRSRPEEHISFYFERNLVLWDGGPVFTAGSWNTPWIRAANNLYWNRAGDVRFGELSLDELQEQVGIEQGSIVADPGLDDEWNLSDDSPARALGFEPFDWRQAGVYGDPDWVALAGSVEYPEVEFAPEPPPLPPMTVREDFDLAPLGSEPPGAELHQENRRLVLVTDEQAASGARSLRVADTDGLEYPFDPHFYWRPHHDTGSTTCRFKLYLTPGAVLFHEWRTWPAGQNYAVGPTFSIRDNTLTVPGQPPIALPDGAWIGFEIRSPVGGGGESWTLSLAVPGRAAVELTVPLAPGFGRLDWLGFCSTATEPTAFYLDDLEVIHEP